MPLGYHIMLRLTDDRVLAPSTAERRTLARQVFRAARPFAMTAFRAADNHVHLEVIGDERAAIEVARRTKIALVTGLGLEVAFERARLKPIFDQAHLGAVVGYMFNQEAHHGIGCDPWFDASNLLDLLEMRLIGAHTRGVFTELLPRFDRNRLLGFFRAGPIDAAPIDVCDLADAAAAAFALPALAGRSVTTVRARRAAVQAVRAHHTTAEIAAALGVEPRSVRKLATCRAEAAAVRAVELQMRLRSALRAARRRGEGVVVAMT
jgi:hypothetical protein